MIDSDADQFDFAVSQPDYVPLAETLRPTTLESFVGQEHLLARGKPLAEAIHSGQLHSMILWGPPGTGKTTLARLVSGYCGANFVTLSAVNAGVKDLRQVVASARDHASATVLFVDEVHRFNKSQQDAFLPHVEDGTLVLIGATTENPSFELNNALLSRVRVYVLNPLTGSDLKQVALRALADCETGLGRYGLTLAEDACSALTSAADGDARRLLNFLEIAAQLAGRERSISCIDVDLISEAIGFTLRRFDKRGDQFYDQISALHKSVRGTDPDAALYWFARMLDGGCDPRYIARRLIRMASEDIGTADPRALMLALDAAQAYERLGQPEGELALAQAVTYLACAAKSNAVYRAFLAAQHDVVGHGSLEVPKHLRNAPTRLSKQLGHGEGYRYAHNEPDGYARGETYMPAPLSGKRYYFPSERGLELRIKEKLDRLRRSDDSGGKE